MFDSNLKASLIEVNQMPSFATESPLDHKIKKGVIKDSISLLNLSVKRRNRIKNNKKAELQKRLLKPNNINPILIDPAKAAQNSNAPLSGNAPILPLKKNLNHQIE